MRTLLFEDKETIVFAGDSVTDAGRGEGFHGQRANGLGSGYVSALDAILAVAYPDKSFHICNMGRNCDTVLNLYEHWQDIMALHPDRLFICIGINDVWHLYDAQERKYHDIVTYEKTYENIILSSKDKVKSITLMTPYYMETNKNDLLRAEMDRYGAVVKNLLKNTN